MSNLDLPSYAEIEAALLAFLAQNGPAKPASIYGPLADGFRLTLSQRSVERPDNSTPIWNNRVQWARKSLKDKGLLSDKLRVWELSPQGLNAAKGLKR